MPKIWNKIIIHDNSKFGQKRNTDIIYDLLESRMNEWMKEFNKKWLQYHILRHLISAYFLFCLYEKIWTKQTHRTYYRVLLFTPYSKIYKIYREFYMNMKAISFSSMQWMNEWMNELCLAFHGQVSEHYKVVYQGHLQF